MNKWLDYDTPANAGAYPQVPDRKHNIPTKKTAQNIVWWVIFFSAMLVTATVVYCNPTFSWVAGIFLTIWVPLVVVVCLILIIEGEGGWLFLLATLLMFVASFFDPTIPMWVYAVLIVCVPAIGIFFIAATDSMLDPTNPE
jgi:hypothetical protein